MNRVGAGIAIFATLGVIALAGAAYVYGVPEVPTNPFELPCTQPLSVRIESIDPKFNLSQADLEVQLKEAIELWNTAAGKEVLVYAPEDAHALPISLIYDARQQEISLGNSIDSTESAQNAARAALEGLQAQYSQAGAAYDAAARTFSSESDAYQREVAAANKAGGADSQTYARLQAEQKRLKAEQASLGTQASQLNAMGDSLKEKVAAYNASVHQINQVVNDFNAQAPDEFEEGQYTKDASRARISIYAYKNAGELKHSLTHELGHALGLGHTSGRDSVMYPYTTSETKITAEDLAALKAACRL